MELTNKIVIKGKHDTCDLTPSATGTVLIGSIRIDPSELDDFCAALKQAFAQIQGKQDEKSN